ncbi:MAG: hypothetical protein ACRDN0_16595 [Trebonia sp.]
MQEAQDAGRRPVHALRYARLLHGYQSMFWHTLAGTAGTHSPMAGYTAPHG